jgi:superoxide dismutase, Fe-Mn family
MMTRRQALKTTALASAAFATLRDAMAQQPPVAPTSAPLPASTMAASGPFTVPPLPYAYDALEPTIDAETMHLHHDKHHAAYVANLNKAVANYPMLGAEPVDVLIKDLSTVPEAIRTAVRNNGGGHYNHSLFWMMMKPGGGGEPTGDLATAMNTAFGSFATFKENFTKAALGQFGSGWAWLVLDGKQLKIEPSANQDSPLSSGQTPLLGVDVWEHAYYLKYQNKRVDYVKAWFNVVNWDFVAGQYAKANN